MCKATHVLMGDLSSTAKPLHFHYNAFTSKITSLLQLKTRVYSISRRVFWDAEGGEAAQLQSPNIFNNS